MMVLRHSVRLVRELFLFARHNKAWWIVPLVLMLLLLAALGMLSQGAAPFIYPF